MVYISINFLLIFSSFITLLSLLINMAKTKNERAKKNTFKTIKNKCCDPFKKHNRWYMTNLRSINKDLVKVAKQIKVNLNTSNLICSSCQTIILRSHKKQSSADNSNVSLSVAPTSSSASNVNAPSVSRRTSTVTQSDEIASISPRHATTSMDFSDISDNDVQQSSQKSSSSGLSAEAYDAVSDVVRKLNDALINTPVQPIDYIKLGTKKYSASKLKEINKYLAKYVFKGTSFFQDANEMISQLKKKFKSVTSRSEKIKLLSVLPQSWNASKIADEFNIPWDMAKKVKDLVGKHGILCGPEKKLPSNKLDTATLELVQEFYRSEDISRVCPGQRECVTVTVENGKISLQRRLVLMNLKEAYVHFKEKYADIKIGFSKFAELRPKECVLALENYGTHTTCVCQYHQNFKLCFAALKRIGMFRQFETFRDLLSDVLCGQNTDGCRFGKCEDCINKIIDTASSVRITLEEEQLLEAISFKQWTNATGEI